MATPAKPLVDADFKKDWAPAKDLKFIKKITDPLLGEGSILKNPNTNKLIFLRDRIFTSKAEAEKDIQDLRARAGQKHPHLLHLADYATSTNKELCSTSYGTKAYYDLPPVNIAADLDHKRKKNLRYSPSELTYMGYHTLSGLSELHAHNQIHGDIRPGAIGLDPVSKDFQILDRLGDGGVPFDKAQLNNITGKRAVYMAPELWQKLQGKDKKAAVSGQKNDMFSLGMSLLFLGTQDPLSDCYENNGVFNEAKLKAHLDKFDEINKGHPALIRMVHALTKVKPEDRADAKSIYDLIPSYESFSKLAPRTEVATKSSVTTSEIRSVSPSPVKHETVTSHSPAPAFTTTKVETITSTTPSITTTKSEPRPISVSKLESHPVSTSYAALSFSNANFSTSPYTSTSYTTTSTPSTSTYISSSPTYTSVSPITTTTYTSASPTVSSSYTPISSTTTQSSIPITSYPTTLSSNPEQTYTQKIYIDGKLVQTMPYSPNDPNPISATISSAYNALLNPTTTTQVEGVVSSAPTVVSSPNYVSYTQTNYVPGLSTNYTQVETIKSSVPSTENLKSVTFVNAADYKPFKSSYTTQGATVTSSPTYIQSSPVYTSASPIISSGSTYTSYPTSYTVSPGTTSYTTYTSPSTITTTTTSTPATIVTTEKIAPAVKVEEKSAAQAEAKPADVKAEAKQDAPQPPPEVKPDPKPAEAKKDVPSPPPDIKAEANVEVKHEAAPADTKAKAESKPVAVSAEVKQEAAPAPPADVKPKADSKPVAVSAEVKQEAAPAPPAPADTKPKSDSKPVAVSAEVKHEAAPADAKAKADSKPVQVSAEVKLEAIPPPAEEKKAAVAVEGVKVEIVDPAKK